MTTRRCPRSCSPSESKKVRVTGCGRSGDNRSETEPSTGPEQPRSCIAPKRSATIAFDRVCDLPALESSPSSPFRLRLAHRTPRTPGRPASVISDPDHRLFRGGKESLFDAVAVHKPPRTNASRDYPTEVEFRADYLQIPTNVGFQLTRGGKLTPFHTLWKYRGRARFSALEQGTTGGAKCQLLRHEDPIRDKTSSAESAAKAALVGRRPHRRSSRSRRFPKRHAAVIAPVRSRHGPAWRTTPSCSWRIAARFLQQQGRSHGTSVENRSIGPTPVRLRSACFRRTRPTKRRHQLFAAPPGEGPTRRRKRRG